VAAASTTKVIGWFSARLPSVTLGCFHTLPDCLQLDAIFGTIARFNTRLAQTLVEYIYVWNVPRYIDRLAGVTRLAAA
jgi:hypothetical protein